MSEPSPASPVKLLSPQSCEQLYREADALTSLALNGERLPVSEETWQQHYQQRLPAHRQPWWIHRHRGADESWALALIEAALPFFAGHFPGQPLLPGVVQINWATTLAAQLYPPQFAKQQFSGLSRIKFKKPVLPGAILRYRLRPEPGRIALSIVSRDGTHTEGRLLYRG